MERFSEERFSEYPKVGWAVSEDGGAGGRRLAARGRGGKAPLMFSLSASKAGEYKVNTKRSPLGPGRIWSRFSDVGLTV
jgi:hypothetical protein